MLRNDLKAIGFVVGWSLAISVGAAQQAQQGVKGAAVAGTVFTSPMVLDTQFAAADRSLWGDGDWFSIDEYLRLSEFTCDGVSIRRYVARGFPSRSVLESGLELAVEEKKPGIAEVKVRLTVSNPSNNHDKSVTIVLEVLSGTTLVQKATVGPLKVEEGRGGIQGRTSFMIPLDVLFRRPALTLRLTVMARDI